jgi:hypothetical protein
VISVNIDVFPDIMGVVEHHRLWDFIPQVFQIASEISEAHVRMHI